MAKRGKNLRPRNSAPDIRSFFSPPGAKKTKTGTTESKKKPLAEQSPKKTVKDEQPEKKKTPTPKKNRTPKKGKKAAAVELDEDEVNIIDEASDEDPIPSKKKGEKELDEDFINDDSEEDEDPIPKKTKKGNKKEKEEKVKRSSSGSSSKENSKDDSNKRKTEKKRKAAASHVVSSSEDEFQSLKATKSKKSKSEVNGKKTKKPVIEVSSSEDEDDMRNVKKTNSKKKKGAPAKKKSVILDSDSDDDTIVPTPQPKKKRERRKGPVYKCESDEEKPDIKSAFERSKPKAEPAVKEKVSKSPEKRKQVSVMDFFGGGQIHRVESKTSATPSNKRKAESPGEKPKGSAQNTADDDMEIHDDDDFDATLSMIDEEEEIQKAKRARTEEPEAAKSPKKGSLASKLAAKAKNESFVPETPEPKVSPKKAPAKAPFKTKAKHKMEFEKKSPAKAPPKPSTPSPKKPPPKKVSPAAAASDTDGTPQLKRGGSNYRGYLARAGPQALGSKEIPEGEENCLEGLTFVITGVLESMERDEAKSLMEKYGGKVTGGISKKTSYLVLGRDGGESKTNKANQLGTKIIDEDGMLDLIRTLPGKKSKYEIAAEKEAAKEAKKPTPAKKNEKVSSLASQFSRTSPQAKNKSVESGSVKNEPSASASTSEYKTTCQEEPTKEPKEPERAAETLLWVDKYKPQTMKQIIGQGTDKSNAKKLLLWLKNWHKNRALGKKPVFNRSNDDGSGCKAALLSGPPGVGKTTTSTIVCQEAGFTFVELNASDTRSKKSLQSEVAELLGNHTLLDYMGDKGGVSSQGADGQKHCLIMDEVDGMAGNEDRGGMAELIQLIKNSKIPIICMCNDRNHQKVRSLANYCFDLRFQRPRVEQIRSAMMTLAYREGIKITAPAVNEIILAANQDVRQVIHNLSMWSADDKSMKYDQVKIDASKAKKDKKLGPFDVCRKVFVGGEETARMSLNDKADLFFHDYSFGPLFVHENYPTVTPRAANNMKEHLRFLAKAADSIADGDLVDKSIRRAQKWSLLPIQAIYSSVVPGEMMRGNMSSMVQFPQWLGKNSSQNKQDRILSELRSHMCLKISGDKRSLAMDYLSHMKCRLTDPLVKQGADGAREVIDTLDEYDLLREDFDNIIEASSWPGQKNPMEGVEPKTKAAFTRQYNKESHLTPYAAVTGAKKGRGRGGGGAEEELLGEEDGGATAAAGSEAEDSDNPDTDAMIKPKKKPTGKGRGKTTDAVSSEGKGKGKGKGRGKGKGKK